jgi:hypothetical protein
MPSSNFTSNGSISIPGNAKNVTIECAGASGGTGGPDAGGSAGTGGPGRKATIYLPDFIARTLSFSIGNQGSDAWRDGGNGGSGKSTGGRGGSHGPSGVSGGGGGGGGSTAIYDSYKNGNLAIFGGGGGGGGTSLNASGQNGFYGLGMYSGNVNTPGNGSTGSSCPNDGAGGGGGGAGCLGGSGGAEGYDNNYGGRGGSGGRSAFDSSYSTFTYNSGSNNYGNGFANVSYDLQNPSITSFNRNPTAIIQGQSSTLSWSTSFANSASISGVGAVGVNGSTNVSPNSTTFYTLTACFGGVCVTADTNVVVYIPPILNIYSNFATRIAGQSVTISWDHTGDGSTVYWTSGSPAITNANTNSFTNPPITLYDSTTYCAYITGLGGTSPTVCVSIIVYQIPTIETFETPVTLDYGDTTLAIGYKSKYANTVHKIEITAIRNAVSTLEAVINLPLAGSAELNGSNTISEGVYSWTPTWDDFGPRSYSITYTAAGNGGSVSAGPNTVTVNIDETPDNLDIPDSDELIRDEAPIISPDVEIVSQTLEINDIDIPIEVKSNYPIQVTINQLDDWKNVREL